MKTLERHNVLKNSGKAIMKKVCVSIPLTGLVRAEWMLARYGQVIPANWSNGELIRWIDTFSPLSYAVDDARNLAVDFIVKNDFEWLLFIDHDVVIPPDTFIRLNEWMQKEEYPVVGGLYHIKGSPADPLVYRGRGNGSFRKWKPGEKVWCDGLGMGCTLISVKLLKAMWEKSVEYQVGDQKPRKVFHTPRAATYDEKTGMFNIEAGTEDLWWCSRVIDEKWLYKTGFKKVANKKNPFIVDTGIRCGHIDNFGRVF